MNVTAVAIVAIAFSALVYVVDTIFKKRNRHAERDLNNATQTMTTLQAEVNSLKGRVETLEKIVTDEKYQLNKEFENLKN